MLSNEAYRAAYRFHEKWAPFPPTLDAWTEAAAEIANTSAEFGNTPLIKGLLIAVWEDLVFESKQRGKPPGMRMPTIL